MSGLPHAAAGLWVLAAIPVGFRLCFMFFPRVFHVSACSDSHRSSSEVLGSRGQPGYCELLTLKILGSMFTPHTAKMRHRMGIVLYSLCCLVIQEGVILRNHSCHAQILDYTPAKLPCRVHHRL